MSDFTSREDIQRIFRNSTTIAIIGLSPKPFRPSHGVARYLQSNGFTIIPVNPGHDTILGEKCYCSLFDIPVKVDTVNVFRRPEHVPQHAKEAIEINAKYLWLQEGVIHEKAASKAREAGLVVVMDRCVLKEHQRIRNRE